MVLSNLVMLGLVLSVTISWAANDRRRIVEFQPGTPENEKIQIVQDSGSTLLTMLPIVNAATIELPPAPDTQAAETYFLNQPAVKVLHQDPSLKAQSEMEGMESTLITPDSPPLPGYTWNELQIGLDQVSPSVQGQGIEIAVVDTGIDASHPALSGVVIGGYSAVSGTGTGQAASGEGGDGEGGDGEGGDGTGGDGAAIGYGDCNGHGTHVAGIVAAVAPQAKLQAVRVLDCAGGGFVSDLISGLSWVYTQPQIRVVNMSLGFYRDGGYPLLRQAIEALHNAGVVLIVSAGNYRYDCFQGSGDAKRFVINSLGCNTRVKFPARYPQTIAVAASTMDHQMAYYSIEGPEVDVTAPGGTLLNPIISTTTSTGAGGGAGASGEGGDGEGGDGEGGDGGDGLYGGGSGTSMAAPHVAGLAALMLSENAALTPRDVRAILEITADDTAFTPSAEGHGRINAASAVAMAMAWTGVVEGTDDSVIEPEVTIDPSATVDQDVVIRKFSSLHAKSRIMANAMFSRYVTLGINGVVGKMTQLHKHAALQTNVSVGYSSTIGFRAVVGAAEDDIFGTTIGDHSSIGDHAVLGTNVKMGHHSVVKREAIIGDRTTIGNHTAIGVDAEVGTDVSIGDHVTIWENVTICDGEVIADGTVIPSDTTVGTCN